MSDDFNMSDPMVFDNVVPVAVPIQIGDKHYVLVEPERDAINRYKQKQAEGIKLSDGELSGLSATEESEAELLGSCLFPLLIEEGRGDKVKADKPVGTDFVNRTLNSIVEPLIHRLKVISGIKAEEDRLKEEAERRKKRLREEKEPTSMSQQRLTSETESTEK